jgi:hypothetical protein
MNGRSTLRFSCFPQTYSPISTSILAQFDTMVSTFTPLIVLPSHLRNRYRGSVLLWPKLRVAFELIQSVLLTDPSAAM